MRRCLLWHLSQFSGQVGTRLQIYGSKNNFSPPLLHHHYFLFTFIFSVGAGSEVQSLPLSNAYFQGLINYHIFR
jgi:hypothetical protein